MYTTTTADYDNLLLDTENPRFVTHSKRKPSYEEIMEYLIAFEEVIDLSKSIKEYGGLVPGERLLVMKKDDKYIVLEGNRRTAAISLLLEPEKALDTLSLTPRDQNTIRGFIQSVTDELIKNLSQFEVDIVPNRDAAIYSLTRRHIDGIKKWSQISKMFFYQQHFDSGKNLKELEDFSGESSRTITDSLRKYSYLRFILTAYREKYSNGKYNDSEFETKIPTELMVQRIFNSLKDKVQLRFDSKYKLLKSHYTKSQLISLNTIFAEIAYLYWDLELINTRNLNKVDDFQNVFFNPDSKVKIPEALRIGELILELENSLQGNITNNNNGNKGSEDDEDIPTGNVDSENEGEYDSENDNTDQETEDATDSNGDTSNQEDNNTTDSENIEDDNTESNNEDPEDPKQNNGRLRDPSSYKYLTSAYQVSKKFKKNSRINILKKELSTLEYKDFTISAMYLTRSLLETYTHEYIDYFANLKYDDANIMKFIPKQRDQRRDSLQVLIHTHINNHLKNVIKNHPDTQALIDTTLSNNNNTALTQIINHHIHSTSNFPDKLEVLDSWSKAVQIINTLDDILFEHKVAGQID